MKHKDTNQCTVCVLSPSSTCCWPALCNLSIDHTIAAA